VTAHRIAAVQITPVAFKDLPIHEQYLTCGITDRDDTGYMRSVDPTYERRTPRW
jgi:hypothetical protein